MVRKVAAGMAAMLMGLLMSLTGTSRASAGAEYGVAHGGGDEGADVRIVNASTGQRLVPNAWGGDTSENSVVWAASALTPPGLTGQDWRLQPVGDEAHLIRNVASRLCLKAGTTGYGPTVLQGTCARGDGTQRWRLDATGGGYRITSLATGDAIESYTSPGDYWAMLRPAGPGAAQRWDLVGR